MDNILLKRFQVFVVFLIIACLLYYVLPQTLFGTWKVSDKVCLNVTTVLAIMFFMAGLGQLLISPFVYFLKTISSNENMASGEPRILLSHYMGYLESVLYPAALLIEQSLFIGLWLTLKAAVEWAWRDREGSTIFTQRIFLIGSGLMILWGLLTYGLIVSNLLI